MKVAVVYNRESKNVINLFGVPNRERYGIKAIQRIVDALKKGRHQVLALEGDKDLIPKLEQFMPRVVKGERPGMVFNLSYGIQGQARYTHVPSILEMMGLPYIGSGPLAHSLALDKVVAKVLFKQNDIRTPDFAVLRETGFDPPAMNFPLIVKPKNESTSFGLDIVHNEEELRRAAQVIFDEFHEPVLAEEYIDGREINVGLIGNGPPAALPPAELEFGEGPKVYTYLDKTHRSGRTIGFQCPAKLEPAQATEAQRIAREAFEALHCYDCARVDMRLSPEGKFYVLEINSLPSLGEHGSYTQAAAVAGMDFAALINRLVEVASARYFGTPKPPELQSGKLHPEDKLFAYLTARRDALEKRLQEWCAVRSRTEDPIGHDLAFERLSASMAELQLAPVPLPEAARTLRAWTTPAGLAGGTLLVGSLDVPLPTEAPAIPFRREPESLYGEGIGSSRAPLAMLEFSLRALRSLRLLRGLKLGVLFYADEGRECRYSWGSIESIAAQAQHVLVLRPGARGDALIAGRRGLRRYRLVVEGRPARLGAGTRQQDLSLWLYDKLATITALTNRKARLAISATDIKLSTFQLMVPHRAAVTLSLTYPTVVAAKATENAMHEVLNSGSAKGLKWELAVVVDRPPMLQRLANKRLAAQLREVAGQWEIDVGIETSGWPSAAGLVPKGIPVVCGVGPVAASLNTPQERVSRLSLLQRTLILTRFLAEAAGAPAKAGHG